jgi:hypothetical protein
LRATTGTAPGGWKLEVSSAWLDSPAAQASGPVEGQGGQQLVDRLPAGRYDTAVLRVSVTTPGGARPSLVTTVGYHRLDGDFGAGAVLVPETRSLFVAGGGWACCYQHDGDHWSRQWAYEVELLVWGLVRDGDWIVLSAETELIIWDLEGRRRLAAAVEPAWSYEIDGTLVRVEVEGVARTIEIPSWP